MNARTGHGLATSITSSSSRTLASSAPAAVDAGTPGPHVADLEKQRAVAQPSPTADRPDAHSVWWDVLFIGTVVSGQLMGQGQIGVLMIPAEQLGAWLGATERGEWSWFAGAVPPFSRPSALSCSQPRLTCMRPSGSRQRATRSRSACSSS